MTGPALKHLYSGKVRELYETPDGLLIMVATDRMSAFDHVLDTPIPDKGKILTQLSLWWFGQLADVVPNHLAPAPLVRDSIPAEFEGRAMACRRLTMVPAECVARGYLAGSGLADYRRTGKVCEISLPAGLTDGSRLPGPVFTPATKAPRGEHDVEHRSGRTYRNGSGPAWPPSLSGSPWRSTGGGPRSRPLGASSWRTPRSSSASPPMARCCSPTRS